MRATVLLPRVAREATTGRGLAPDAPVADRAFCDWGALGAANGRKRAFAARSCRATDGSGAKAIVPGRLSVKARPELDVLFGSHAPTYQSAVGMEKRRGDHQGN